jgi:predicted RNase H-like HicB family nuclease
MSDPVAYVILIGPTPNGHFGAWAPDLPGCIALGDTVERDRREMRDAIAFHIEGLRDAGEPVPEPSPLAAAYVDVAA